MKSFLIISILLLTTSSFSKSVQISGFGLGAMIGDPTALSFKGHLGESKYFDAALAFNTGPADAIYLHGDYLIEKQDHFQIDNESLNLYYGIGARLYVADTKKNDDEVHFGPRVPVGVAYNLKDPSVEFFGEISAIVNIIPETDVDIDLGIGARYWF